MDNHWGMGKMYINGVNTGLREENSRFGRGYSYNLPANPSNSQQYHTEPQHAEYRAFTDSSTYNNLTMHTRSIDFNNSSSIPSHSGPPYNDHHSFEPSFEQAHRHMRAAENSVYSRDHATPAHHSANTPSGSTRVFCPLMARPPEPAEQHSLSRPHITSPVRFPGTIPDYPAAIAPLNRSSLNQLVHPPPVHAHPIAAAQPPPQVPIAPPAAALPPPKVPVAPPAAPLPPQQAPVAPPAPIAPPAPSPSRAHTLETHVDELSNKADARKSESDEEDLPDPKRIKLSTSKSKSKGAPRGRVSTKGRAGSPIQGESGAQETKLDVGSGAGRSWTKQDDGRLIGYITDFNNPERFKYAEKGIKKGFWDEVRDHLFHGARTPGAVQGRWKQLKSVYNMVSDLESFTGGGGDGTVADGDSTDVIHKKLGRRIQKYEAKHSQALEGFTHLIYYNWIEGGQNSWYQQMHARFRDSVTMHRAVPRQSGRLTPTNDESFEIIDIDQDTDTEASKGTTTGSDSNSKRQTRKSPSSRAEATPALSGVVHSTEKLLEAVAQRVQSQGNQDKQRLDLLEKRLTNEGTRVATESKLRQDRLDIVRRRQDAKLKACEREWEEEQRVRRRAEYLEDIGRRRTNLMQLLDMNRQLLQELSDDEEKRLVRQDILIIMRDLRSLEHDAPAPFVPAINLNSTTKDQEVMGDNNGGAGEGERDGYGDGKDDGDGDGDGEGFGYGNGDVDGGFENATGQG